MYVDLYRDFIKRRMSCEILETEDGFAIYSFGLDGKSIHLTDFQLASKDSHLVPIVEKVIAIGKSRGCTQLFVNVLLTLVTGIGIVHRQEDATHNLRALLMLGMKVDSAAFNNTLLMRKDI